RIADETPAPASPGMAILKPQAWPDRNFSGVVPYDTTITLDRQAEHVYLDFGEGTPVIDQARRSGNGMRAMLENPVRDVAVVYVKGKPAGAVWCPPYKLEITSFARPGQNAIRIEVANTALNVLAKGPLPDYQELTARYGERFQSQDMQLVEPLPSGLLQPVRLVVR